MRIVKIVNGKFQENCFIVINEETHDAVIIDGGVDIGLIDETIKKENINVKAMLLTHFHFDHSTVAKELKSRGIKIYISDIDAVWLNQKSRMAELFGCPNIPCEPTNTFNDDDEIKEAGMTFKVVLTPGHTQGSCCFLLENIMFSGDTLFFESVGRTDSKESAPEQLNSSLIKLFLLDKDYQVYPGHGENTTISHEKQYNPYIYL